MVQTSCCDPVGQALEDVIRQDLRAQHPPADVALLPWTVQLAKPLGHIWPIRLGPQLCEDALAQGDLLGN